jgi:muconolactone delta-isomerase
MRALVTSTPKVPPPPDAVIGMIDAAERWQERYASNFESFGLFPGGGGYGIVNVEDEAELHRMLAQMPFGPFSTWEIRVIVDGATGWGQMREAIAMRNAG